MKGRTLVRYRNSQLTTFSSFFRDSHFFSYFLFLSSILYLFVFSFAFPSFFSVISYSVQHTRTWWRKLSYISVNVYAFFLTDTRQWALECKKKLRMNKKTHSFPCFLRKKKKKRHHFVFLAFSETKLLKLGHWALGKKVKKIKKTKRLFK